MDSNRTHHRGRTALVCLGVCICMAILVGRLFFLMIFRSDYYYAMAEDLHQRERTIKAARGEILDRNGAVIAANRTVCTVSVVHNQLTDPEPVSYTHLDVYKRQAWDGSPWRLLSSRPGNR